jgi:hypothetical protein
MLISHSNQRPFHMFSVNRYALRCAAVLVCCTACTPAMREFRQRPPLLARDWLDAKKTTPGDTSIWRLTPNGKDLTIHVIASTNGAGTNSTKEEVSPHGAWYLRGALDDSLKRLLCFSPNRGRVGASCIHFAVDTLHDGQLRLTLRKYVGTHETAERVLVERQRP